MWIFTQDRKQIINSDEILSFETASVAFSKNGKHSVVCITANSLTGKTLGVYENEKCALNELENIFEAVKSSENTYCMP